MAVVTSQEGTIFVGGEFKAPRSGATLTVLEKATGESLAQVGAAGVEDVDDAVAAAAAAQPGWAATGYDERAGILRRAGGESNLEEFTERRWVTLQRAKSEYPY